MENRASGNFRIIFYLFSMNSSSFTAIQLVHDYLISTGDTLNSNVCQALGLSSGKHYLHDIRHRLALLGWSGSVHYGNLSATGPIGSSVPAVNVLKMVIEELTTDVFSTNDLRNLCKMNKNAMSKALKQLEFEGIVERVSSSRPNKYRHLSKSAPDFIQVFMRIHEINALDCAISLRNLPLLANRVLCGKSIDAMDLTNAVTGMISRYSRVSLPLPPIRALEPFLLAVLKEAGDYRAVTRELEKVLREAKAIRRAFDRLSSKDGFPNPLAEFTMPHEWLALFEQPGKISTFVEAVTDALGAELHPKEAKSVSDQAIEETIDDLKNQGIFGRYDTIKIAIIDVDPSFHDLVLSILHDNIRKYAMKVDLPVKKFNIKELYRKVALEMYQDQSNGPKIRHL